jgi:hypothetical protein
VRAFVFFGGTSLISVLFCSGTFANMASWNELQAECVERSPRCTEDVEHALRDGENQHGASVVIPLSADVLKSLNESIQKLGIGERSFTSSLLEKANLEPDGNIDAQDDEDIKGVAGVLYGGVSTLFVLLFLVLIV